MKFWRFNVLPISNRPRHSTLVSLSLETFEEPLSLRRRGPFTGTLSLLPLRLLRHWLQCLCSVLALVAGRVIFHSQKCFPDYFPLLHRPLFKDFCSLTSCMRIVSAQPLAAWPLSFVSVYFQLVLQLFNCSATMCTSITLQLSRSIDLKFMLEAAYVSMQLCFSRCQYFHASELAAFD